MCCVTVYSCLKHSLQVFIPIKHCTLFESVQMSEIRWCKASLCVYSLDFHRVEKVTECESKGQFRIPAVRLLTEDLHLCIPGFDFHLVFSILRMKTCIKLSFNGKWPTAEWWWDVKPDIRIPWNPLKDSWWSLNLNHFKNHWFSKAKHIICTCWFHSGMQRASLLGNKHSLWPVCLHCAVLMLCWEQMSSPPDECSLYYYTPPSGSPHRSLSVSAPGGAWLRTVSLLGHSPWTVSAPSHLWALRGNLSSLSPGGPGRCSLLYCIRHRGLGWSLVAVSPAEKYQHNQRRTSD